MKTGRGSGDHPEYNHHKTNHDSHHYHPHTIIQTPLSKTIHSPTTTTHDPTTNPTIITMIGGQPKSKEDNLEQKKDDQIEKERIREGEAEESKRRGITINGFPLEEVLITKKSDNNKNTPSSKKNCESHYSRKRSQFSCKILQVSFCRFWSKLIWQVLDTKFHIRSLE